MKLAYNGITLGIVQVIESSKTVEYDPTGQDYLWTRYRLAVEAIYSPDDPNFAVAYTSSPPDSNGRPNPLGNLVKNQTSSPVYTDIALRHRLMQPRGVLLVDFASGPESKGKDKESKKPDPKVTQKPDSKVTQLWLESPPLSDPADEGSRRPCDMANGPLPQEDTIVRDAGDGRTFVVRFVVETCLNECQFDSDMSPGRIGELPAPPLLSNRWTASMSYDEAGYATRVFSGVAVFRADALRSFQEDGNPYWAPDAWRLWILPDVPVNSIRYVDELKQAPDGFTYTYTVRDVEQEVSYIDQPAELGWNGNPIPVAGRRPRSIRSISCEVIRQYQTASTKEVLPAFLNSLQQAAWGFGGGGGGGDLTASGIKAATLAISRSVAVLGTLNTILPTYSETAVCTIRGTRNSTKTSLLRTAYSVVFGQLSGPLGKRAVTSGIIGLIVPSENPGSDKAKQTVENSMKNYLRMTPPGYTFQVRYDAFKRQVQVTVGVEYGGLLDWTSGATIGGMQAMCQNIPEQVIGGTWPFYLNNLQQDKPLNESAGQDNIAQSNAIGRTLPPLEDVGNLIGTIEDAPGIDIPLAAPPPSYYQPALSPLPPPPPPYVPNRQGTQLFNIIAQSLLGSCGEPALYAYDRSTSFRQQRRPPAP